MMATAANTISRTVTAVTTTAPWSWTSWLELFRARLRQLVDHGDDHARALHVGDPHRRAGGDRRPVGRLGPPLLPVDAPPPGPPPRVPRSAAPPPPAGGGPPRPAGRGGPPLLPVDAHEAHVP